MGLLQLNSAGYSGPQSSHTIAQTDIFGSNNSSNYIGELTIFVMNQNSNPLLLKSGMLTGVYYKSGNNISFVVGATFKSLPLLALSAVVNSANAVVVNTDSDCQLTWKYNCVSM